MLPKPDACRACPYYGNGHGFVPAEIRPGAPVLIMAQNPGESEERGQRYLGNEQWEPTEPRPLIGRTGRMLERTFLPLAGLTREDVSLDNAIRCRITHKNEVPGLRDKQFREAIRYCQQAHGQPSGAHTYVAMGEPAMYALTGRAEGFSAWRGYVLPRHQLEKPFPPSTGIWTPGPTPTTAILEPVLVVHHLAYLFREPQAELPAKSDWNKLRLLIRREWPQAMSPSHSTSPNPWPPLAAFDTEFGRESKQLVRWSLATPDREVWVVEHQPGDVIHVPDYATLVMHNAAADLPYVKLSPRVTIEDTMYAHAVLWTGAVETDEVQTSGAVMSHTLNFLGSMYARINRWKHLRESHPRLYAGADALGTMDAWQSGLRGGLHAELKADPRSYFVYETLQKPLIRIIMKARQRGIKTSARAVAEAIAGLKTQQQAQGLRAQLHVGWPLKLSSPKQLAYWLYQVERVRA